VVVIVQHLETISRPPAGLIDPPKGPAPQRRKRPVPVIQTCGADAPWPSCRQSNRRVRPHAGGQAIRRVAFASRAIRVKVRYRLKGTAQTDGPKISSLMTFISGRARQHRRFVRNSPVSCLFAAAFAFAPSPGRRLDIACDLLEIAVSANQRSISVCGSSTSLPRENLRRDIGNNVYTTTRYVRYEEVAKMLS